MERTLCIFKPDLVAKRANLGDAFLSLIMFQFSLVAARALTIREEQAAQLYSEHVGRPYYQANLDFVTSGPSVAMVLERHNACAQLRWLVGETDPKKAQPDTFRALYGSELPRNAVHASANPSEAEREIEIFFPGLVVNNSAGEQATKCAESAARDLAPDYSTQRAAAHALVSLAWSAREFCGLARDLVRVVAYK